jgi:hypothetical protein
VRLIGLGLEIRRGLRQEGWSKATDIPRSPIRVAAASNRHRARRPSLVAARIAADSNTGARHSEVELRRGPTV